MTELAAVRTTADAIESQLATERENFAAERKALEARYAENERHDALELDRAREAVKLNRPGNSGDSGV